MVAQVKNDEWWIVRFTIGTHAHAPEIVNTQIGADGVVELYDFADDPGPWRLDRTDISCEFIRRIHLPK